MKTFLRKIFLLAAALLLATAVHAYDFSVDNEDGVTIRYNILSASDKTCEVAGASGVRGNLVIPETVSYSSITFKVIGINFRAFWHGAVSNLFSVTIPNSITQIDAETFYCCYDLVSVKLPDSLKIIGAGAFDSCKKLTTISIPNTVSYIGKKAFNNCTKLTSLKLPDGLTCITEGMLGGTGLSSIDIPASVTTIEDGAFAGMSKLENFEIPNTVTSLGTGVFYNCNYLKSVKLPDSITSISDQLFGQCYSLTSIEIPKSVTSIGYRSFYGCGALTSIEIPESVTQIGFAAFFECWTLASIEIPNTVTQLGDWAFVRCEKLASVTLSNSLTKIGEKTFYECKNLRSVVIPSSVTSVGESAFENCAALTSVTLGSSIESIGAKAFALCHSLTDVVSNIKKPFVLNKSVFPNIVKMAATLYVPRGTKMAYRATEGWKEFLNIEDGATTSYRLTLTANGDGAIRYNGVAVKNTSLSFEVEEGGSANLTIEADEHRELASLTMDGEDVTGSMEGNVFTIADIDKDVEIVATFRGDANTETIVLQSDMQTFCSDKDLDFNNCDGLEAYIVSGFKPETNEVLLTRVSEVPAGTGLIIRGEAGKRYLVTGRETSFIYLNFLKGVLSDTSLSAGYLLNGDVFEMVNTPTIIHANNAYLSLPASVQAAKILSLKFSEESTNIDLVKDDMPQGDSHWYNQQGTRLNGTPTTPGIYIRNGRKVWVK